MEQRGRAATIKEEKSDLKVETRITDHRDEDEGISGREEHHKN